MREIQALFLGACIVVVAGCGDNKSDSRVTKDVLPPISSAEQAANKDGTIRPAQIEPEKAEEFARQWQQAATNGDTALSRRLVDWDGMVDRAISGLNLTDKIRNDFKEGVANNGGFGSQIALQIRDVIERGGSYELLRIVSRGNETHAVFRLIDFENGMNYHDLRLNRMGGSIVADRFYLAATGEELAETLRTTAGPVLQSQANIISKLSGEARDKFADLNRKAAYLRAARGGDYELSKKLYESLSEESKNAKIVMVSMVQVASQADENVYLAAMDRFAAEFPNDPALGLMTLDAAILRDDSEQLERCRQILEDWTGGDSYIDAMIAYCLLDQGDLEDAQRIADAVDPKTIDIPETHDYLLEIALAAEDYEAVLMHLKSLRDRFNYEFEDLRDYPEYRGFVESPQFKLWESPPRRTPKGG